MTERNTDGFCITRQLRQKRKHITEFKLPTILWEKVLQTTFDRFNETYIIMETRSDLQNGTKSERELTYTEWAYAFSQLLHTPELTYL